MCLYDQVYTTTYKFIVLQILHVKNLVYSKLTNRKLYFYYS
jgi:hypothetical protein